MNRFASTSAALALGAVAAGPSQAALQLSPVQLHVPPQAASTVLSVKNAGQAEVRLKISVSAWRQGDAGEELTKTEDVILYPPLFTLAPGVERSVRVATRIRPGASEQTYRLLIEELPNGLVTAGTAFILNYSLPVFIDPAGNIDEPKLRFENAHAQGSALVFDAVNAGNAHVKIDSGSVKLTGDAGEIAKKDLDTGYVLAGMRRRISVPLPEGACAKVREVRVDAMAEQRKFVLAFKPEGGCGPSAR
ncbi:MAG TPA: fimbria/pilus periplasmic chaperone [Myxococcales bacterium]|jgi:fimbrial chaperone protein|nr:fimbria/pilus periplasmic chaperone [Myxococcales bacterium]